VNQKRWNLLLGGWEILRAATARKGCILTCHWIELSVSLEWTESGREFQIVGAAKRKEREPKVRLVRETCKRLEEEDNLNVGRTVRNK